MSLGWLNQYKRKIFRSYVKDVVVISLIFIPWFFLDHRKPYERPFWRDDQTIRYPHKKHEIIPDWILPFITFGTPSTILTLYILACQRLSNKRMLVSYLGLFLALGVTLELTTVTKLLIGRHRPDFLARCDLDLAITQQNVCRGSAHQIIEGRKSFPSGHASMSFAGLGYAGLFLTGQLGLLDGSGYAYKLPVVLFPYVMALLVSITRIMDFRHHWQDVVVGAALGLFISWLSYRLYFPSLWTPECSQPYSKRFTDLIIEKVGADRDAGPKEDPTAAHADSPAEFV